MLRFGSNNNNTQVILNQISHHFKNFVGLCVTRVSTTNETASSIVMLVPNIKYLVLIKGTYSQKGPSDDTERMQRTCAAWAGPRLFWEAVQDEKFTRNKVILLRLALARWSSIRVKQNSWMGVTLVYCFMLIILIHSSFACQIGYFNLSNLCSYSSLCLLLFLGLNPIICSLFLLLPPF